MMTMICEGQKGQREAEIEAGGCPERRNSRRKGGGHVGVATALQAGVWRPPWHRPCSLAGQRGAAGHACRRATQQAAGPGGMPSLGGRRGCTGCRVGWGLLTLWNPPRSSEQGTPWRSAPSTTEWQLLHTGRALGSSPSSVNRLGDLGGLPCSLSKATVNAS